MARYVVEHRIGEGGTAEVLRARAEGESGFARTFAVKRLLPELARDPAAQARFIDEARIAARLHHPCIVSVLDFYEHHGVHHLVMEYVDGPSLQFLVDQGVAGRFMPPAVGCRILLELARALEYAHANSVLHRDVSCCNVLVSREGEVKLADFGLAAAGRRVSQTDPGEIIGKALYLSPQRRRGARATPGDDLYALGMVLARIIDATDPRERTRPQGRHMLALLRRMVQEDPARRPPSAAALVHELRASNPAPVEDLAEYVRDNPRPRRSTPPPPARRPLAASELDDTTDSGQALLRSEATTEPDQPAIEPVARTLPEAAIVPMALGDGSDDTTEESITLPQRPLPLARRGGRTPLLLGLALGLLGLLLALAAFLQRAPAAGARGADIGRQASGSGGGPVLDTSTE